MQSSAVSTAANRPIGSTSIFASPATTSTLLDPEWIAHLNHESFASVLRSPYPTDGFPVHTKPRENAAEFERLMGLFAALHAYDPHTAQHSLQVEACASRLTRILRIPESDSRIIRMAAVVHDIGKMAVPKEILTKPGRLTPDEFAIIKRHPSDGAKILEQAGFHGPVVTLVLHHHEWYDGTGYQAGLKAHEIPFGARVLQTADCIDAMMSPRSYKAGFSPDQVIEELIKGKNRQFDPVIADAAVEWLRTECRPA